jgi:hypothetical protein
VWKNRVIRVFKPLYMCPTTAIYVSSYCYICLSSYCYICLSSYSYMFVLILLYMRPRSNVYVSSCYYMCLCVSLSHAGGAHPKRASRAISALTLQYMCPHTATHMSPYYMSVLILLCVLILLYTCPHTTIYVGGAPQDVLGYTCPHTAI